MSSLEKDKVDNSFDKNVILLWLLTYYIHLYLFALLTYMIIPDTLIFKLSGLLVPPEAHHVKKFAKLTEG